jgi:EAL domain-containing protein (putative c-di-GMP-specific phosphodiesterase class I)
MRLENDLHKAVEKNEFYLVYQPILSLSEQMIFGFEALIRWNHSKLGLVSPLEFISLAEENGTIIKIGQFVLEESCRQLQCWNKHFGYELPLTISVNVSAKQLLHRQFFASVVEIIEKYKVNPQNIKLEITESVVVENSDLVISVLKQLRAIGLSLSMDDFGTGYSSLSYLHKLPINTLKIDRSFVNQIENEAESSEIVKTIVLLAKNLNLDVVAEGIETEGQNLELTKMNCNFGQGFLFSKPLNVGEATTYLKNSLDRKNYPIISEVQFDFESVSH